MRYGCCAQYQSMRLHRLYPRAIRKSCNFQEPKRRKTEPDEPGLGRAVLRDEGAIVALPNDKQGWLWKTQIQEEDTVFIFTQLETARKYLTLCRSRFSKLTCVPHSLWLCSLVPIAGTSGL